jgi:hypothetical protein
MDGNTTQYRITQKWTSKDSLNFKSEAGSNAASMMVMEDGKESRVTASPASPPPK